jgi:hypothetical protein
MPDPIFSDKIRNPAGRKGVYKNSFLYEILSAGTGQKERHTSTIMR